MEQPFAHSHHAEAPMHRNVWISNATKMGSTVVSLVAGQHLAHIQTYGECTW